MQSHQAYGPSMKALATCEIYKASVFPLQTYSHIYKITLTIWSVFYTGPLGDA
jgi:hypothetical protein